MFASKRISGIMTSIAMAAMSLALIGAVLWTAPALADRIDDLYIMAMEAEDNAASRDDYRQAVKLYRKITDTFSDGDNGELIAASLFSIGDILNKRLDDQAGAREAFERIIRQFSDTSWVGRAEQEISKLKPSSGRSSGAGVASAVSGIGLDAGALGLGMGTPAPRNTGGSAMARTGNYVDPSSGIGFYVDPQRWSLDTSMPHPGFLAMLKPAGGGVSGYPNVTFTVSAMGDCSTSAEYADKVKSDARSLLPMYKVVAEQDIQIAGQTVHEVFSYYVQNGVDIIHKQSYITLNGKVYTLTCSDMKNNFLGSLEAFKALTESVTINGY